MLTNLIALDGTSEQFLLEVRAFIDEWNNDDNFIKVTTSGSTGEPKLVELSKERIRASARSTGEFFGFIEGQSALLNLSPSYIAGKLMIVRAIEHGMILLVAPLGNNPLKGDFQNKVDFAAFVPSQIAGILADPISKRRLNGIKNIIIGGAPLHPNLENELTTMDPQIYASFGMTETITHFALRKIGTPIYKCLQGFRISADDKSCLVIHPNEIVDEILFTNDVIDLIDEHTFKWSGRFDNVINSGGIKIYPEKAEKMIAHLFPDNRFYISSKSDPEYGEVAVLVVEGEFDNKDILTDARESLPKHHAPKALIVETSFEETPTQKVKRKRF